MSGPPRIIVEGRGSANCRSTTAANEMGRREFIALLGGSATVCLAVRSIRPAVAQTADRRVARIGLLLPAFGENDPLARSSLATLDAALRKLGWTDGANIQIERRFAASEHESLQKAASDLVKSQPELILGATTPATAALHRETTAIPIVFVAVSDPVGSGFVVNLASPGANITGFTTSNPRWLASGWSC